MGVNMIWSNPTTPLNVFWAVFFPGTAAPMPAVQAFAPGLIHPADPHASPADTPTMAPMTEAVPELPFNLGCQGFTESLARPSCTENKTNGSVRLQLQPTSAEPTVLIRPQTLTQTLRPDATRRPALHSHDTRQARQQT